MTRSALLQSRVEYCTGTVSIQGGSRRTRRRTQDEHQPPQSALLFSPPLVSFLSGGDHTPHPAPAPAPALAKQRRLDHRWRTAVYPMAPVSGACTERKTTPTLLRTLRPAPVQPLSARSHHWSEPAVPSPIKMSAGHTLLGTLRCQPCPAAALSPLCTCTLTALIPPKQPWQGSPSLCPCSS